MLIKHYKSEAIMENPWNLKVIKYHDSQDAEVLHLTLGPGERMLRHIPPITLLFYVLEGKPTMEVGDEKKQVETDSYVESPKGAVTCVYNETEETVRLLIVKSSKSDIPPEFLE